MWLRLTIFMIFFTVSAKYLDLSYEWITVKECTDKFFEFLIKDVQFKPINKTYGLLSFKVSFNRPLDDNVGSKVQIFKKNGAKKWQEVPSLPTQPNACKVYMKLLRDYWVSFFTALGVEHPDRCPVPAGNYTMKDYAMEAPQIPIPVWSGTYKFRLFYVLTTTGKELGCMDFFMSIK